MRALALALLSVSAAACTIERKNPDEQPAAAPVFGTPADEVPGGKPNVASDEERWSTGMIAAGNEVSGTVVLRAVRTARHDDFERVVFEFQGAELPNYKVEYTEPTGTCGSGEPVAVAGRHTLEIRFDPAAAHDDAGQTTVPVRDIHTGMANLMEVKLTCDFEAVLTWVAGLVEPNRFRVLELRDPTRLVVDVR